MGWEQAGFLGGINNIHIYNIYVLFSTTKTGDVSPLRETLATHSEEQEPHRISNLVWITRQVPTRDLIGSDVDLAQTWPGSQVHSPLSSPG